MKNAILAIGTMTNALKARKLLQKSNVRSKLIKLDSTKTLTGCSYGLEIFERDLYSAFSILRDAEISYSIYNG